MGFMIKVDDKPVRVHGRLPLLPLRDIVIFPHMTLPLFVGRPQSVAAMEQAWSDGKLVFAVAQRRPEIFAPLQGDLYATGSVARVLQLFRLPDGTLRVLIEGLARAALVKVTEGKGCLEADLKSARESTRVDGEELAQLLVRARALFHEYASATQRVPEETRAAVRAAVDPGIAAYLMAANVLLKVSARQELLESPDVTARLRALVHLLAAEIEILQLERKISREGQIPTGRAATERELLERSVLERSALERNGAGRSSSGRAAGSRASSSRREFDGSDPESEVEEIERQIRAAHLPPAALEKALRELDRLGKMATLSPEATVTRTYLDWLVTVPWRRRKRERIDLARAEQILDEDHHGLAKVKERVLEHLAVLQLTKHARGPVICLVGPPGVGKTSLGRSIARSLGRRFVRMSLGGVRDEAEIRGHRRTYIGSMPGRIIQGMRRAGTVDPVLLLDEIDKLGSDYRGDPAAALLEVLDPEQNGTFNDHYLEVDYDLSRVIFLTTANSVAGIPPALLDRMELIRLSGYVESDKAEIARRFLIPKQREAHGLNPDDFELTEPALARVLREYTREAGVRSLERTVASLCRKAARAKVSGRLQRQRVIDAPDLDELLGAPRYSFGLLDRAGRIGVATGLAWTESGGEILSVEARVLPGRGRLILTGTLGETMRESAQAALSYIRANAPRLRLDPGFYRSVDIHIHVPEGGVPKDGPSAGVTIALALVSALTERPTRAGVAVTGEITLRGLVLPVGGIPEKAVAACRAGATQMLLPERNVANLADVPPEVREKLEFLPVRNVAQVLRLGLGKRRTAAAVAAPPAAPPATGTKRSPSRIYASKRAA